MASTKNVQDLQLHRDPYLSDKDRRLARHQLALLAERYDAKNELSELIAMLGVAE